MRTSPLTNRGLTLPVIATLVLLMVLAALVAGASAVSAQGTVPDAPDQPIGTVVFVGGVDLEWNEVPVADSYDVQLYQNGQWIDLPGDGVEIAFYGAGAVISGLDPNSTLWFHVRAKDAHGSSDWSNVNSVASTNQFRLGRRARPDNVPASGAPLINGTAQVGESLTADTTGIEDGNGLDRVQFRFQWVSHDGGADTDIASETDSTYTLVADDAGKTIKVRVAFTDRGGYSESLTGGETATVAARPNSPATGAPAVTGTAQVGETLTSDTSGIADVDGLTKVSYRYQWVASDGTSDTDIPDATDSTYTLAAADEGRTVKVKVSFTDDAGNGETLTSSATAAVDAALNTPATGAPAISGTAQVGETLTADTSGISDADGLASATFAYQWLADDAELASATGGSYVLTTSEMDKTIKVRVSFTDDAGNEETLTSTATGTVSPAVQPQTANSPATGAPIITGTAEVGEILTASTSGIADDDGLENATFSYQWIANDGISDTDLTDATGYTYTLVAEDVGNTIKVRVSFTDDAGTDETLTSTETEAVSFAVQQQVANNPATGAPTFSGTTQEDRNLWADTSGIADADGLTKVSYSYQWIRNDGTSDTNITDATESWYFLVSDDVGQTIKVKVTFTDDAGNQESLTSEATGKVAPARPRGYMTVVVTGTNSTVTWNDSGDCSTDYNIYKRSSRDSGGEVPRTHLGFATSGSSEATVAISESSSGSYRTHSVTLELYCGTYDSDSSNNELVASTEVPIREGTYSWAPLTALTVSPGTLTPDFDRGGKKGARYTVEVPSDVEVITLYTAVLNGYQTDFIKDPGWGIVRICGGEHDDCIYGYGGGFILSDADPDKEGFQINLDRGENRLGIGVNLGSLNVESLGRVYKLTVTVQSAPATGTPTINGTAQVEETLTADTSGIADADGLTNISYSYQWIRDDGTSDTDIAGATDATYTLVAADVGKTIKVRVTFTDDASNDETLTSEATGAVATNGAPTGTVEVGETLTADTSGIKDEDGLDNVSFSYQWIRTDGTADLDIDGATSATYTIAATDVGHAIKVRVSYTDDAGNVESLTSAATVTVPIEVTFTFSIEGTTVTCDYYNIHIVNEPYKECDDPTSIEQGTNGEIEVGIEIARSVSAQLYKFDSYIYQVADSLGHYWPVDASDLCQGPGLADSALIEVTPNDGTGPFTYTDEGTIFELCPAGTYQLYVPWYRYNYTDQEYELAGQIRRYFFITSTDEGDTSIEQVKWITALYPDPPVSNDDVQIEATKASEVLNRELATFSLSIGGLIPDSDPETTDYVVRLRIFSNEGRKWPLCHVGNVGYSYLLKTVPEDGEWAMEAHVLGNCLRSPWSDTSNRWADTLQIELFNDSYEFIAGKDIALGALPNNPATGAPTISDTAQVGETLTADTAGIADDDGLTNVSYSYQWIANDGGTDADISGETDAAYTLVADDEGKTIKVKVTFTDDAGNDESLTSTATSSVAARPNSPATGAPTISGAVEVGEALIVNTSGIADDDGLDNVSYSYQWVVNDGTTDTDISGETDATYTLVDADQGKTVKVRVSFTDDAGNEETLASSPSEPVEPAATESSDPDATRAGAIDLGDITTLARARYPTYNINGVDDVVDYFMFTITEPKRVQIGIRQLDADATLTLEHEDGTVIGHKSKPGEEHVAMYPTLLEGAYYVRVEAAEEGVNEYRMAHGVNEPNPDRVAELREKATPSNGATGAPTIGGTAQVEETLTADISGIADDDGLENVSYSYQWVANDGTADTDITDAADSTYTLVAADEGKTVKVQVSFTDDAGNEEALTSAATDAVASLPNNPATGVPTITGVVQVGETLTAETISIADADGLDNAVFSYQWLADDADISGATGKTYALTEADEGKTVKVQVSFTDDAGNEETLTSAATDAVASLPNSPATGAPTITGVVQVGETLTAETTGIADADGLDNAVFSYQWLADDADISGATGKTYALTEADEGKTVKVQVSFTDDAGNEETLTSAATDAVASLPNSPATGVPTITGVVQVGETLTAETTGIADADGLDNAVFSYQWLADDADISGATGKTYALTEADEGKTVKVQVSFTDDAGNEETLTSAATDAVASLPNSPATGVPTITGVVQVGETLTAETTGIADADGLDNAVFSYQWLADDADISGATGKTYALTEADEGKTVKVQVSFTDDAGNEETLTSAATDAVASLPNSPATGAPTITLSFLTATPAHVSQLEVVGIYVTADHVYIAANGGGLSSVWMFGGSAMRPEQYLPLDFEPRGLAASSAHLYVLDASGTAHAYDLETLSPDSSSDIRFALRGTDNPAASLRGVYALAAYDPGFTGPDSGMGLVYAARRIETGVDKWEVVGPPGVGVHHDELVQLGITDLDGSDVATDLSTYLFVENGTGDGAHVFEVQPSGSAELSHGPELYFGRTGHDGLYYDGSLLWTLDVDSYEWDPNDGQTLTLRAFDPAQRTILPDHFHELLHESDNIGSCDIENLDDVEDLDHVEDLNSLLLPDLVSCQHDYSVAEVVVAPDGTELHALRFAGFVTNLGYGPLDLKGNPQLADDADLTSHDVWQRALTVDGDWVNLTKPPIKFERVDGHGHFHLRGIVEYSLWDTSGTVEIRSGAKVGFCLLDVEERPDLHPNPGQERYMLWDPDIHFCKSGRPGAKNLRMGISEGWQDIYSFAAPFQWIDVSNVRPGYYRVGQRVDPDNVIVESDETNNGLALSQRLHVVPGYVARPETVRVEPDATVRFKLSADEYFDDTNFEDGSTRTRAHRIVTQPSHGSLDVGDTVTVIVDGATYQVFTDEWVTYTPDPGYAGADSFTFVALDESLPRYPINPVVATVTLDITDAPTIRGTAQVGETLTADTSGIGDTDSITGISYSYQWVRNDGTNDTDITGATDSTYTMVAADEGRTIKVGVSFTDDAGNEETLTSAATSSVTARPEQDIAPNAPDLPIGTAVFVGGVDLEWNEVPVADSYEVQLYQNGQWIDLPGDGVEIAFYGAGAIISGLDPSLTLWFQVRARNAHGSSDWSDFSSLSSTNQFTLGKRARSANEAARGAPVINGTAQVGEILTADTTGIEDGNGLDRVQFRFQWATNDGSADTDIAGATNSTYTLAGSDEGKTIKVRVAFTDRGGYAESLTSDATETVSFAGQQQIANNPATGGPIIGGTARVGETLATDVLGIADEDGLENATFSYQWISNDGTTDADIQGETGATYTLTDANEGKTVKVRVSFTDDADNEETVTSAATATVAARPNRPATGAPIIGGTVRVGETLATDVLGIADEDGLENATFSYQWISNDGTTDADIQGETGATYTLTDANEGKTVKVRVSFTDDADNEETVTSAATATVAARPNRPATGAPIIGGTVRVGETLATDVLGIADEDGLENATFSYQWISNDGTTDADIQGETGATYTLTDANEGKTVKVRVSFTDDADNEETVTSAATATVAARPNRPATGAPIIGGTVRVGETLATDVLGIADEDGLENATFSYQWISNDGTTDADIQGETGATYTLASAYVGKTIKVKVTFTDDADNEETLTSPATAEVAAGVPTDPPAKPRNLTGTANSDGTVTLRWDAPDDDSVTGYQILRRRPTEGERTLLVHVNDTGSTATEYTDNDVTPDVLHAYRVKAINAVGLSRRSEFVNVTPTQPAEPAQNAPATGTPTISGNAQVGETLTAGISEIADEDGLENAVFSYQWVASNGTTDTNIAAATDSTYDLVAADAGKTIKVRVSFTDDAGNEETLTSTATNTVTYQIERQISNSPATGAPSVTGTAQVGDTLTADTSSISDDDGLTNVSYQYQWLRNDGNSDSEIAGATDSTYALADDDEGNTVKVRVSFTDDAGTDESLTSPATATVAARISSPATGVPSVTGTAQVGRTLTADTSGIADDDGLTNVSYQYQWVRTEINDSEHVRPEASDYGWVLRLISEDIEIAGGTNSTYTLVAADGRYSPKNTIKVRVSFTDDKGNEETLTSTSIEVSEKAITISQPYEPPQNEDSPVEHAHIFPLVGSGYGPDGRTWELEFAVGPLVPDDDATTKDYIINYRIVDENGDPLPNCEGDGLGGSLHFMTVSDQVGGNQHSGEVGLSCRGAYFALIEVLDANSNFIDRIVINVS